MEIDSRYVYEETPVEHGRNLEDATTLKTAGDICLSLFLFLLAGLAEIGGGYLVWKGIREKYRPALMLPLGSLTLIAYGFIPTLQPLDNFGRIYAVYGGFFIVLSYAWAHIFDGTIVDTGDIVGSVVALIGVCICWFWPR